MMTWCFSTLILNQGCFDTKKLLLRIAAKHNVNTAYLWCLINYETFAKSAGTVDVITASFVEILRSSMLAAKYSARTFYKKSAIDGFIVMPISRWFRIEYISSVRVAGFI